MTRAALTLTATVATLLTLTCGGIVATAQPLREPPLRITEDMPGWDCETMGNRICGPVLRQPDSTLTELWA